jgi:nucleoside-diphosphate-sugar epimerase
MRVLVTGAAGVIGQAVVRRLRRQPDVTIRGADVAARPRALADIHDWHTGDLSDDAAAQRAVADCDTVIHLAAVVGGIANWHRLPYRVLAVNTATTRALLTATVEQPVERFLYTSSSMVFERASVFPTPEQHVQECPPPRSAYGFSKLAGERLTVAAHEQHALPFTICRPFNAYGREMPGWEPGVAHVITDLVHKVLQSEADLEIFGSGYQTRTFTYVDDVADGLVTALLSPAAENEDFNISGDEEITIRELAALVHEAAGLDAGALRFRHLPAFADDVQRRYPLTTKAELLLGWRAKVPLTAGLHETVQYMRTRLTLGGTLQAGEPQ